jgi:hypothetical protein
LRHDKLLVARRLYPSSLLGVALGLVMLMWFGSGMVMMYVGFPEPSERERLDTLAPIAWAACCRVGDGLVADDEQFRRAEIETFWARRCCGSPACCGPIS